VQGLVSPQPVGSAELDEGAGIGGPEPVALAVDDTAVPPHADALIAVISVSCHLLARPSTLTT
jgi:hypothetical protein